METIVLNLDVQRPIICVNGKNYFINTHEIESFFKSCSGFMPASTQDLIVQTQIISETLIDQAPSDSLVGDLKNNIKFLREIEFLIRDMLVPIE